MAIPISPSSSHVPHLLPSRILTELDHIRISKLLQRPCSGVLPQLVAKISDMIDNAELLSSYDVPPDVVTMYSQLLLADTKTGEESKLTLCYPVDAAPAEGLVSVLTPVGSSLLGLKVGQPASWTTPLGEESSANIVAILFQPEQSGDYLR